MERRSEEERREMERGKSKVEGDRWQLSLKPLCVPVTGSVESWEASCREG